MRLRHPDGTAVHLSYCTNVHLAEDLSGLIGQLAGYAEPVRESLGADRLGVGLWLARDVVTELRADPSAVHRLRTELAHRGLEVVTLNAFPYRGFARPVVKKAVYQPDWTDPARCAYTMDCARLLAQLLPPDAARGSISTLPLAWRDPWDADRAGTARRAIDALGADLADLERDTGRTVRVAFEPEPGCVIDRMADVPGALRGLDPDRFGVCLDTCHLAVSFESTGVALAQLAQLGLPLVKVQASAALAVPDPADPAARAALAGFAEPRFLHQVRERRPGAPLAADDLPDALAGALPGDAEWRVHFHLPLHAAPPDPLRATTAELETALTELFGGPAALVDHVEVETYTWPALPGEDRPMGPAALVTGLTGELDWMRQRLTGLGCKEEPC
jgi:hypothetical protein